MKKIKYKQDQYGTLLNIILLISIIQLIFVSIVASNTSKSVIFEATIVLLLTVWLFFYKLTIIIDDKAIYAIFGIGLLKKKIPLSQIDLSTLEIVKPSLLTGIGIRYTKKGWLWNVKFGKAIYFKTKNGKTFFVGTDDADKIKTLLKLNN